MIRPTILLEFLEVLGIELFYSLGFHSFTILSVLIVLNILVAI